MKNLISQDLLQELQFDKIPQDQQAATLEKIGALLFQSVVLRATDTLSDEKKDEFVQVLDAHKESDSDVVYEFLETNVPNLDEIVEEELLRFKAESKRFVDTVRSELSIPDQDSDLQS